MKSSTLHRSTLSKERMSMVQNVKPQNWGHVQTNLNEYIKFQKKPELDVLWRDFEKSVQSKSRAKAPVVYLGMGFILGLLFALVLFVIIGISTYTDTHKSDISATPHSITKNDVPVSVMPSGSNEPSREATLQNEEKYTIKEGDTLDKIAFRFYGEYNQAKIDKIMELNNIKNPTRIQIGQVLIIPLN